MDLFAQRFEVKAARERLVAGDSPIEGLGVFAKMGFRPGDLLCVMQGEKISIPELKSRYAKGTERISDPLQVSERQYLDMLEPFVRINHSCEPNVAIIGDSSIVAVRYIDKGEEITYDYSMTEWTWNRFGKYAEWEMNCACGERSCRGLITQFPLLPFAMKRDAFRKGRLQDFIMRKVVNAGLAYKGN